MRQRDEGLGQSPPIATGSSALTPIGVWPTNSGGYYTGSAAAVQRPRQHDGGKMVFTKEQMPLANGTDTVDPTSDISHLLMSCILSDLEVA